MGFEPGKATVITTTSVVCTFSTFSQRLRLSLSLEGFFVGPQKI